jgi:hypothetical protein
VRQLLGAHVLLALFRYVGRKLLVQKIVGHFFVPLGKKTTL